MGMRARVRMAALLIAAALVAVGVGGAPQAPAAMGPLRIGLLVPLTGYLAAPGKYMVEGITLFLKQHNNTLAGRRIDLIVADSRGDPLTGLTQARKLVEQNHVALIMGPLSAAVGSALAPYLGSHRIPAIYPIVSSDDLTQRKHFPYLVRTGWTSSQTTMPLGDYAYRTLGYRRVATIAYDFEFGWQSIGGFVQTFQQDGGKVVKEIWTPQTTTNFSPYLSEIPQDIDAVMVSFSGSTAINFIQQYHSFGLREPIVGQGNLTDESTLGPTGPSAIGIIDALHYSADLHTPANQAFVKAYMAAYGHVPSYYSEGTYVGGMFLQRGLDVVHGDLSNPDAFVKALHAVHLADAPRGPVYLDSYGNPVENVYIRKVEQVNGQLANVVIHTFFNVSQFWTYPPATFLAHPVFSRTYPPCNACGAHP
jgi:branched-chain amino acid transport system substrate-binding protein